MKMTNQYVATVDLDEVVAEQGGFIVASKNNKYKRLEVKHLPENLADMADLKVGSTVYVLATAGVEVPIDGVNYTIIKQHDIILIK